jgi:hypothetical protein
VKTRSRKSLAGGYLGGNSKDACRLFCCLREVLGSTERNRNMARKKKPTLVRLPNNNKYDGKVKQKEVFVPDGSGGIWRVVHATCVDCDERFIQIHGNAMNRDVLFTALERVVDEQMSDLVGNGAIKFCLEVNALNAQPRPH